MSSFIRPAVPADRNFVITVLAEAFANNPSVLDAVYPDAKKEQRVLRLMEFAFDVGIGRGTVYVSADECGTMIFDNPVRARSKFSENIHVFRLINGCIGWRRLSYLKKKQQMLASKRPATDHLYLSYIGVRPGGQGKGTGGKMVEELKKISAGKKWPVYLETSWPANVKFYEQRGFEVFDKWKIREDYVIHFMRYFP